MVEWQVTTNKYISPHFGITCLLGYNRNTIWLINDSISLKIERALNVLYLSNGAWELFLPTIWIIEKRPSPVLIIKIFPIEEFEIGIELSCESKF